MAKPAGAPGLTRKKSVIQFVGERQDEKELRDLFNLADKQRQGSIGPSQLRIILNELGVAAGAEESQLLFEGLDVNGDGRISFQEFTAGISWLKKSLALLHSSSSPAPVPLVAPAAASGPAIVKRKSLKDFARDGDPAIIERAKQLFGLMDEQHKGQISLARFATVFKELDLAATDAEIADLFKQLDVNSDGSIGFQEFVSGMQRLNKAFSATTKLSESAKGVAPSEIEALQSENALLRRYLKENLVERAIKGAERAVAQKDFAAAKVILELLDLPRVEKLEEYVGALSTVELNDRYETVRKAVASSLKP